MYGSLRLSKRFLLIVLIIISVFGPAQTITFAASEDQMITDEWLQNQDNDHSEPAQSDTDTQEKTAVTGGKGLSLWDYVKMLFALLFVLALLLFVLKFINKKSHNYNQNSLVRNIGGVNLGAQKSVQLVQIGNSIFIVGVGENVQLLKEIENPDEIEQIVNNFNEKQSLVVASPYITELVKKLNIKMKKTEEVEQDQKSFGEIFNHKLSDIKKERHNELEKWKEKERDK